MDPFSDLVFFDSGHPSLQVKLYFLIMFGNLCCCRWDHVGCKRDAKIKKLI